MKKVLLLLLLAATSISSAFAQETTTDYMYTEGVKYDDEEELYYFDVYMKGSEISYTAYGTDIQLPSGLKVVEDEGDPFVVMLDKDYVDDVIYPVSSRKYTHQILSNFIDGDAHHIRLGCYSSKSQNFLATSGALFRVYIEKEETSWPIGAIKFFNAKFVAIDETIQVGNKEQGYSFANREDIVVVNESETTLPLKVSTAAKWSTCILPFATEIPEGVTAYTCSNHDEEYIYLEKAESFEAYTPYILYAENGYNESISGTVDATIPDNAKTGVVANGYLNGAIVPQTATEGYVLQNHEGVVQFYAIQSGDSFTIPAGKCWMKIPEGASRALSFKTEDEAAGINNITIPVSASTYDLSGRMQKKVKKGVFIKNGKKTLSL